ncbi:MAG: pyridoxal phosphate-dependent aminotransferase, partial [Gemmobacter sp.]
LALFDPGDCVAIARPGYPAYRNILAALGLTVVEVEANAESGFTLTPENLARAAAKIGRPLKGVLLASPANPTGTVTGRAGLKALADYCRTENIAFISDEIYHGLTFAGEEASALEVTDDVVVINSFSKYYCMTGWRIGWMVLPEKQVRGFERIAQSLYISPPELSQIAAEAALGAQVELDGYKAAYAANREMLLK